MKKVTLVIVAALAFIGVSGGGAYAQGAGPANQVVVRLTELNGSGQSGTATLMGMEGGKTTVMLAFSNGSPTAQPAHIHKGTCATLDPKPTYPLTSPVNGASDTTVDASLEDLLNGTYAINIHKSPTEADVYTACGDIVNMQLGGGAGTGTGTGESGGGVISEGNQTVGMPRTGNSDQTFIMIGLIAFATMLTGTGMRLARRKI